MMRITREQVRPLPVMGGEITLTSIFRRLNQEKQNGKEIEIFVVTEKNLMALLGQLFDNKLK